MHRILITGGTGFIGRNLTEQLSNDHIVIAPSSAELNLLDDRQVARYVKGSRVDVVIHAATWNATRNSRKDTSRVLENNLRMFFNLARCNQDYGKMIYFGSGAEYDKRYLVPRVSEDYFDAHVPADQYGLSKYLMRKHASTSRNIFNLCLFGVFGKYEDWELRFISNACCKALFDLPVTIKQNVLFDYLHVDDLAKIVSWFIANTPQQQIYNVCRGSVSSLRELATGVLTYAGKNLEIRIQNAMMGTEYSGNNERLLKELPALEFTSVEQNIPKLYDWYNANKDRIARDKLLVDK